MLECDTRSKDLQNGTPDKMLVALLVCHIKETPECLLTPAIGRSLEICPKNEVGSLGLRDQIGTEAVMRLWDRG